MAAVDVAKWEAFRHVKVDDAERLEQVLSRHAPELWMGWRNFAGKTLYQVAEMESNRIGRACACLQLLRGKLEGMDLVPHQVPRVSYVESVQEVPQVVEKHFQVEVPEVHFHKTLKHIPKVTVTEVPEVMSVPQYTYREELQVVEDPVSVPRPVPHTTITEVPKFVPAPRTQEISEEVPLELALPPVSRPWIQPVVEIDPKVHLVQGEVTRFSEEEEIIVPHEVYVPKTEVHLVKQEVVRQKEVTVPNVTERAVPVYNHQEEVRPVTQTETTVIQRIRYVPSFPMKTEWQPRAAAAPGVSGLSAEFDRLDTDHDGVVSPEEFRRAGGTAQEFRRIDADHSGNISRSEYMFDRLDTNHDGVITRQEFNRGLAGAQSSTDLEEDMWYGLNMLRYQHKNLLKKNARFRDDIGYCMARVQDLKNQLEAEKLQREEEERVLHRRENAVTTYKLASIPVRKAEDSIEVDLGMLSTPQSTIFRESRLHDLSGVSTIGPGADTSRADDLFDRLDTNHDGVISRDEFSAGFPVS